MGVKPEDVLKVFIEDRFKYDLVRKHLSATDQFKVLREEENPHLKEKVAELTQNARRDLGELERILGEDPEEAPEEEAPEEDTPESAPAGSAPPATSPAASPATVSAAPASSDMPPAESSFMASLRAGGISQVEMEILSSVMTRNQRASRPAEPAPEQQVAINRPKPAPQEALTV